MRCNLEVLDFYSTRKLNVDSILSFLVSAVTLYILIKEDGVVKELSFTIPKKYRFARRLLGVKHASEKVDEYNVLVDYLLSNKKMVKDKYILTNRRYNELIAGLKYILDSKYATGNKAVKQVKKLAATVKDNMRKFISNIH